MTILHFDVPVSRLPTNKVRHLEKQQAVQQQKEEGIIIYWDSGTVGHFDLINCFNCIKSVHKLFLLWDYWDTRYYSVRMKLHPHEFVAPTF